MRGEKIKINLVSFVQKYSCLIDKCPSDCCTSWNIEVDYETLQRWSATKPELLGYTEQHPKNESMIRMKMITPPLYNQDPPLSINLKSPESEIFAIKEILQSSKIQKPHLVNDAKHCKSFNQGVGCGIHQKYGQETLPDICNSYPHLYKSFCGEIYLSATPSCPSICYIINDDEEEDNFKIIKTDFIIKRDLSKIFEYIDNKNNNRINGGIKINPHKIYNKMINLANKHNSIRSFLIDFVQISHHLSGLTHTQMDSDGVKIIEEISLSSLKQSYVSKINYEYRMFYKEILLDLFNNLSIKSNIFVCKIQSLFSFYKTNSGFLEEAFCEFYYKKNAKKDHYFKYLRRLVKAKLSEVMFPYGIYNFNLAYFAIIICVEILIIEMIFAIFFYNNILDDFSAKEIIFYVDRVFYSKSNTNIFQVISSFNLDKIENIIASLLE
jgi:hypothetical protein